MIWPFVSVCASMCLCFGHCAYIYVQCMCVCSWLCVCECEEGLSTRAAWGYRRSVLKCVSRLTGHWLWRGQPREGCERGGENDRQRKGKWKLNESRIFSLPHFLAHSAIFLLFWLGIWSVEDLLLSPLLVFLTCPLCVSSASCKTLCINIGEFYCLHFYKSVQWSLLSG